MKTKIRITIFMTIIMILSAVSFAADIQLLSPKDNEVTNKNNLELGFTFRYTDSTGNEAACELYVDSMLAASKASVKSKEETTLYSNLEIKEGMHYYEVKCGKREDKNASELRVFTYDKTSPVVQTFNLEESISCIAKDKYDDQVTVSVIITDTDKKFGTCKATDNAGNYVIVDQTLKIIEKSTTTKEVTIPVVETKEQAPLKNDTIVEVVEEVASKNITEETKVDTTIEDINMEDALNESTIVADKKTEKNDTAGTKEENVKIPINFRPAFIVISLIVLIAAALLAFYMFRKENEVVIIK